MVCPSTHTFGRTKVDWERMCGNVSLVVAAARRYGACGLLLTTWGDGGHRAPFLSEIPALVYTAAQVRGEELTEAASYARALEVAKLMPRCVEVGEKTWALLDEVAHAKEEGALSQRQGEFATRFCELWLVHNRVGGLVDSMNRGIRLLPDK